VLFGTCWRWLLCLERSRIRVVPQETILRLDVGGRAATYRIAQRGIASRGHTHPTRVTEIDAALWWNHRGEEGQYGKDIGRIV
jgi:hypothetical protein